MFTERFNRKRKAEFHGMMEKSSRRRLNSIPLQMEHGSIPVYYDMNAIESPDFGDTGTDISEINNDESTFDFIRKPTNGSVSDSELESELDLDEIGELVEDSDLDIDVFEYIKTLEFKLRKWAVNNNITLLALSELLKILKEKGHKSLPVDARTLLRTPGRVAVSKMGSGQYWYGGMRKKLSEICKKKNCPKVLELTIHIDGTPIYKSSKSEFWPVQCDVKDIKMKPYFVSIYQGASKPISAEVFMRPLLDETNELLINGLSVEMNNKIVQVQIKISKFILDAPARAFLKCIIGHNGYFSCERCEEEGQYLCKVPKRPNKKKRISGHVCLVGTNAMRRTDESFRKQENQEHHNDTSPLEELPIDMARDIPLEYLHLILYGAMKRLLILWTEGTTHFKFTEADIREVSKKHVEAGVTKPTEINRPNRSLTCLSFWKAAEFRTFLLKTGPIALRDHLTEELYNHFLTLHCAVTICCSESMKVYVPVAEQLFRTFTQKFGELYGNEYYTYSIHSLIHVTDDVERFGVFDEYSAFPGESNLGYLKRLVRGGYLPLQQVIKRIAEREQLEKICEFESKQMESEGLQNGVLRMKGLRLDSSEKNKWILTKSRDIFKITRICKEETLKIYGAMLLRENQENFYNLPIASKKLNIYQSKLESKDSCITLDDIFCKLYRIELSTEKSAFMPLFHFTQ